MEETEALTVVMTCDQDIFSMQEQKALPDAWLCCLQCALGNINISNVSDDMASERNIHCTE